MADVVDIKADHFYANDINQEAYFEGNAKIKQDANEFNASKITVFFNDARKAKKYRNDSNKGLNVFAKLRTNKMNLMGLLIE